TSNISEKNTASMHERWGFRESLRSFQPTGWFGVFREKVMTYDPARGSTGTRKAWNTSFESSRPDGVKQIQSSLVRASSPRSTRSSTIGSRACSSLCPNFAPISRRVIPRFTRNPRKKTSSRAALRLTTVFCKGAPAIYFSSESAEAKRTASDSPDADNSMECASTPNPRCGCLVQYFKLCLDSKPGCAKLEIS